MEDLCQSFFGGGRAEEMCLYCCWGRLKGGMIKTRRKRLGVPLHLAAAIKHTHPPLVNIITAKVVSPFAVTYGDIALM